MAPLERAPADTASPSGQPAIRVTLLGTFEVVCDGSPLRLQPCTQRLLAFTALQDRPVSRFMLAATLWPETEEGKAGANLRSTLWRLGGRDNRLLCNRDDTVRLQEAVRVDVDDMLARARGLLAAEVGTEFEVTADLRDCLALFEHELLPGWWDEWVLAERERLRVLQLHALERLAERLLSARDYAHALECCLLLIRAEPFRESAHRLLIAAHVAEGNLAAAVRHYRGFRDLLREELGLGPSSQMDSLMASALDGKAPGASAALGARPVTVR